MAETEKKVKGEKGEKAEKAKAPAEKPKKTPKKQSKRLVEGTACVRATFNNTKITITDAQGNVYAWTSAAKVGFKGSRKSTPFAAQVAGDAIAKDCIERFALRAVHVKVNGPGPGRESAIRSIESAGIKVLTINDVTGIPHNGCRDPKKRRN